MSKWKTENWEVSEYNWSEEVRRDMRPPDRVELHDVTLRDGAHVVDFSDRERIELASALSDLGVTRIEIESRASTIKRQSIYPPEKHWETLRDIANMGLKTRIFTMRNVEEGRGGIDKALECNVTNIVLQEPVHRSWLKQVGQTPEQRLDIVRGVITYAKERGCHVDFFNNHICNSELSYVLRLLKTGVEAGADTLCITDSEGIGTPQTFNFLVGRYVEESGGRVPIGVHPHNDFGLALADAVAGYEAGASIMHCSVNGLGARAGNISLEECAIAFHVLYGVELGFQYDKLGNVCASVELMQQWPVAKNKPFNGYGILEAPYRLQYFGKTPHEK